MEAPVLRRPLAALPAPTAPFALYDEDGRLGGIRDLGDWTPKTLFREAWYTDEMAFEWEDLAKVLDDGREVLTFSVYKRILSGFRLTYWRIAETEEETYGEFGAETYFPCSADYPTAVGYWDLRTCF